MDLPANEVRKVLTTMASIFIPLMFFAGPHGMDFDYMPELRLWWAYPALLLAMAALAGSMVAYFRKKRWM
jgi:magnesium transporter